MKSIKTETITFRLTSEEKAILQALAVKEDVSVSKLMQRMLAKYIEGNKNDL